MVNYQVFLSFRGPETFENLAKHLHDRLTGAGITTFLDREEIQFGQNISNRLINVIRDSDICILIFSPDFASSAACRMEVAKMVELGKEIRPIFFFVKPRDVRHQLGTYATSFEEHKRKKHYPEETIQKWKNALEEIGDILGPEFKNTALEVALEKIGDRKRREITKAVLEAALGTIDGINGPEVKMAALEKIDSMKGCEMTKADLETALEAALEKIGVIQGPDFTKAVEASLEKIGGITKDAVEAALAEKGGPFYNDLFDGFQKLDAFISDIWKLSKRIVEEDVTRNLLGIDRDVPEMMRKLGFSYENGVVKQRVMTKKRVLVLVVSGMAGVGKTTLAKVVFHKIKHLFRGCSFLEHVQHEFAHNREVSLLNKLIRELKGGGSCQEVKSLVDGTSMIQHMFQRKRVLILLDDVDHADQIKPFAEELTWFGPGSAIILTTTNDSVADFYKNPHQEQNQGNFFHGHKILPMVENHALELFYKHAFPPSFSNPAFQLDRPREDYENWSSKIIHAVECLPYAIERVGSYLNGKSHADWTDTLNCLEKEPQKELEQILKKHFNSLHDHAQKAQDIFLDIACFFTGVEKTIPCNMWDAHGWTSRRSVGHLENMSFLRIGGENEFSMHNQLKLLGRHIVEQENPGSPWERSRLWDCEDVRTIVRQMRNRQGPTMVKTLRVASDFHPLDDAVFDGLLNLRFLELDEVDIEGNREDLLPDLVWLDWHGRTEKSSGRTGESKLFAFNMEELVILKLCSRPDKLTLDKWGQLMQKAGSLQVLNLKDCPWIHASLEFPDSSLLKRLILEGCLHLELNAANSNFKILVSFNIKGCKWVKDLTRALHSMKALDELLIDGTNIGKLQFQEGSLPALETLSACNCEKLHEVTDSLRFFTKLKKLFLRGCKQLHTLPHVFEELGQLQEMDLSRTSIKELPPSVKHFKKLQVLKMARTFVKAFPETIKDLKELKELDFSFCGGLNGECCDITGLFSLRILRLEGTKITEVLAIDETKFCLHILEFDGVTKLTPPRQKKTSVPKSKRKRRTQTSQKDSRVSQNKRRRDEE